MQASQVPAKFLIPFANAAGGSYIRNIPQASQIGIVDGAASLTDGFPPLNFLPVGSGGIPPFGQDFNGILNQITQWIRWDAAGGQVGWDATFSAAIGGYPKGAIVTAAVFGYYWICTVDNNTSNPDTGGAGWTQCSYTIPTLPDYEEWHLGTAVLVSANTFTAALSPTPQAGATNYISMVQFPSTNTGAATLNGAPIIVDKTGAALTSGQLPTIARAELFFDGTSQRLKNPASTSGEAKAWVVFSVASGIVMILRSFNVSSVVRTAAGQFTINQSVTLSGSQAVSGLSSNNTGAGAGLHLIMNNPYFPSTFVTPTSVSIVCANDYLGNFDAPAYTSVVIHD